MERVGSSSPPPPVGDLGRLSSFFTPPGTWTTLAEHRRRFPAPPAARRQPDTALIEMVERSGLRGRGGASFPTAAKLRAVAAGKRQPIVLANGSEGEPASYKDALIMTSAPHLVLDGALLAASAVGAEEVIVGIALDMRAARAAIDRAERERYSAEPSAPRIRIVDVPARYVAGEERALVNLVNRGRAIPPPGTSRPFERGVAGRPTLVQNVETLAHLATIRRNGPEWFKSVGTAEAPGTMLVSLGGAVADPGVYEIEIGTTFVDLLSAAGGATERIGGVLTGGYAGTWLSAEEAVRVTLDQKGLSTVGGFLGCGIVSVLPASACGLRESSAVLRWMAGQTAGQCGPCVHGLAAIAQATEYLRAGRADGRVLERLERWSGDVEGRGACRFPDGAVRFLRSALRTFAADIERHAQGYPCIGADQQPMLPLPLVSRAA